MFPLLSSPRTTIGGIVVFLSILFGELSGYFDNDPATTANWNRIIEAAGLLYIALTARDNNKTSTEVMACRGILGRKKDYHGPILILALCGSLVASEACAQSLWLTKQEIQVLPMTGPAWTIVKNAADTPLIRLRPNVSDQDDNVDQAVLAKALVFVRTGQQNYRDDVVTLCLKAIDTEKGDRTLALGRNLCAYVIAADLVQFRDTKFDQWLQRCRSARMSDGRTLHQTHEERPNNWGTMAGASRVAVSAYLGDKSDLDRAAKVFKGYLGDRSSYAGFKYGDLSWQADPSKPVGINPVGARRNNIDIDGVMPDDMRRGGGLSAKPTKTGYPYEGLQGVVTQAELLHRAGYPAWEWENRAILRAFNYLARIGWHPEGDDTWQPWLVNYRYKTTFATSTAAKHGKIMGWTSWTHSGSGVTPPPPPPPGPPTITEIFSHNNRAIVLFQDSKGSYLYQLKGGTVKPIP